MKKEKLITSLIGKLMFIYLFSIFYVIGILLLSIVQHNMCHSKDVMLPVSIWAMLKCLKYNGRFQKHIHLPKGDEA